MNKLRQIGKNPIISILLSSVIIFTGCTSENVLMPQNAELSGEEMFREIFLFQGENLSKKIPYYEPTLNVFKGLSKSQISERNKFCDEIVINIRKLDPNYFDHFKRVVQSDNLYRIKDELMKGSKLILAAISISRKYGKYVKSAKDFLDSKIKNYDLSSDKEVEVLLSDLNIELKNQYSHSAIYDPFQNDEEICVAIAVAVALVVVLAVWEAVATVNVIAVATVAVYAIAAFWPAVDPTDTVSELNNDKIVVAIADNY